MDSRLGLLVTSLQELKEKLETFLTLDDDSEVTDLEGIYQTPAKTDRETINQAKKRMESAGVLALAKALKPVFPSRRRVLICRCGLVSAPVASRL